MKAVEARLLDFFKKSNQFVIPIYQRTYSWAERECRQLWDDIIRTGNNDKVTAHFAGSIVYVERGLYQVSTTSPLLVIDGQQRLTTLSLLLEVLARALGTSEPVDGFSAVKIRSYYLLNPFEEGERRYKLVLTQTDETTLKAIVDGQPLPRESSLRVNAAFEYFRKLVAGLNGDLTSLCKGLAKLAIVDISLDRSQDNPQLIFESLNSTGLKLSQADLVRNFILMGLEAQLQTRLYKQYWRPMEEEFGQEGYAKYFDSFMRHYLTVKTGTIPNVGQVYDAFKEYARSSHTGEDWESLVNDIRTFAGYYCAMALVKEKDSELQLAFRDIRDLTVEVAYPFMLELYSDYVNHTLRKEEFLVALRLIESYVFRRAVCDIPPNSLNKTFANFSRDLKKDRYLESIHAYFMLLPSYRRFPTDDEFKQKITTKDLYNFRSRSYWLRRLENYNRKERVSVDEYTIEHIMPQNENLPSQWRSELGSDWKRIWQTYLNTLGNLTLTGYNSEYSDKPFVEKRDMKGGFAESPLRLNEGLAKVGHWTEESILERGKRLAALAREVWLSPTLESDVLKTYESKETRANYSIEDHPHLVAGPMHELFLELRKQVLALDPCVTEEFLKLYVAYKAESNFVDVVPQLKRLVLMLNMPFPQIEDPKKICRDLTGRGKWGNGDVEVELSSFEELPYVIGLVRQAFENQMGSADGTDR